MSDATQTEVATGAPGGIAGADEHGSAAGDEPRSTSPESRPASEAGAGAAAAPAFGSREDDISGPRWGTSDTPARPAHSVEFLRSVEVNASVELGRVVLPIGEVLELAPGSVVHLDKMLGDPVDLMIKDKLVARGEVVVVDDKFGLRITEIVSSGSEAAGGGD